MYHRKSQVDVATISSAIDEKIVIATAGMGMFLSTLDTGIMNITLPTLNQEFQANVADVAWTVTIYSMILSITIVVFGRLSDRYGQVKIYRLGLLAFAIASVLAGFSFSIGWLVLFRALQGIGAAMIQATAIALITTRIAPQRKGIALGTLGIMIGLGPVLGPVVGGFILSSIGWRWIFWINVPFCLLGIWGCSQLSEKKRSEETHLDGIGNLFLAFAILMLLLGLSKWSTAEITNYQVFLPFILFGGCLVSFLIRERQTHDPIIDLNLFYSPLFTIALLATTAFGAATAIVFIVPPYFLEKVAHLAPWQVGWVSLSAPLGLVLMSIFSGKVIYKYGSMKLMFIGLCIMLVALILLSTMQPAWGPLLLVPPLFLYGIGGGIFQPPNIAGVMDAVGKERQGTIGAIQRMIQNIAIALGASISAALIQAHLSKSMTEVMLGFRFSWFFSIGIVLVSIVSLGLFLIRRDR